MRYEHVWDFHCWFYKTFPHNPTSIRLPSTTMCYFSLFHLIKYSREQFSFCRSLALCSSLPLPLCHSVDLVVWLCWDFIKISFSTISLLQPLTNIWCAVLSLRTNICKKRNRWRFFAYFPFQKQKITCFTCGFTFSKMNSSKFLFWTMTSNGANV